MKYHQYLILSLFVLLFCACNTNKKELLIGEWEAVSFMQSDSLIDIDLSMVSLSINNDNTYCYHSNLLFVECGNYGLKKDLILLNDTLNAEASPKTIAYTFVHNDSLKLFMSNQSTDEILLFGRKK